MKKLFFSALIFTIFSVVFLLTPSTTINPKATAACGQDGATCTKDADCCTAQNFACDTKTTQKCYNLCTSGKTTYPTAPATPSNWKVAPDNKDKIPMTVTAQNPSTQKTPFIWSPDGQIKVVANFSKFYYTCAVNPGDGIPVYGIALANPSGTYPYNNNQQYTFWSQSSCDATDEKKIFVITPPKSGGWYDIFLVRFLPVNQGDHKLATDLPSGIASDIVHVYVGPDTWTKPATNPPASCSSSSSSSSTSTDPCDALRKNTVLQHGDGCNVKAQCDPNYTQAGKSQTCPDGTTCRAAYNAAAYQQDQTYCLAPNEGETTCQHETQPCDLPPGSRKCCTVGQDGNQHDLLCIDNTNASGSTCQRTDLPSPPAPPCAQTDSSTGKCLSVVTAFSVASGKNGTPTDPAQFINEVFQILLGVGGGIALLLIMFAGYRLMVSQGKPEALQQAREQLIAAIVGILFFVFSIAILEAIGVDLLHIPGLTR